jgi:hypothetical protein
MINTFTHGTIDLVQSAKKQAVKQLVPHEGLASALNTFVDSQTAYTKSAVDAGVDTLINLSNIITSANFVDEISAGINKFFKIG